MRSRLIHWLAYFSGWTLFALFFITEDAGRQLYQRRTVEWHGYLVVWLTTAYAWALLAPAVWWLSRRVPFERQHWLRNSGLHLILSLCFAVVEEVLFAAVTPVFGLPWFPRSFAATFRAVVPIDFHLNVAIYWLIVVVQHGVSYYRKYLAREQAAAQLQSRASGLESQLAKANLSALKLQLQPHFLFNTLNTIVVLVRQNRTAEADEMLTNLSELLRQMLEGWDTQEVPLRREVELIGLYLDIQRARFQDRLTVETDFPPATLDALVPSLLLQPLVENAVRHGVSNPSAPVRIELKSRLRDAMLELQICDDGPGLSTAGSGIGVGLGNTRARLQQLYGDRQSLRLEGLPAGGTVATVSLPYHAEEEHLP